MAMNMGSGGGQKADMNVTPLIVPTGCRRWLRCSNPAAAARSAISSLR